MLEKTKGIVLNQLKYSDSSKIVTLYTKHFGKVSFMVRIPKNRKRNLANNVQALYILDLDILYKPGRDIQTVKEWRNAVPFSTIPYDVVKSSIVMFLAEVIYKSVDEEASNNELYNFLENTIQYFDLLKKGYANFHLVFLLHLTKYLGFYPKRDSYAEGYFFDMLNGLFVVVPPLHNHYMGARISALFFKLLSYSISDIDKIDLNKKQRDELIEAIITYYKHHLLNMREIKSFEVLKTVFS